MAVRDWKIPASETTLPAGERSCVRYLLEHNSPSTLAGTQLSFRQLAFLFGKRAVDKDCIAAANFVVSAGLFSVFYVFIDDDGRLEEVMLPSEIELAGEEGGLAHPRTGEFLPDYEKRLSPLFVFYRVN
jgi:hypothetical protein